MRKTLMIAGGLILLFAFGFVFYRALVRREKASHESPLTSLRFSKSSVSVPDQPPKGEVSLSRLVLVEPAYAVLHEDENGPGKVIGYTKLLQPGVIDGLKIASSEKLEDGYYYVVLHADDGDGTFEPDQDQPIRSIAGKTTLDRFLVSTAIPSPDAPAWAPGEGPQ